MYIVKCTYHNEDGTIYKGNGIDHAGIKAAEETIEYLQSRYDVSDISLHMYYRSGKNNDAFNAQLAKLEKEYNMIESKWNGDYLVTYYSNETENVEYWENMELGIPSEIIFKY